MVTLHRTSRLCVCLPCVFWDGWDEVSERDEEEKKKRKREKKSGNVVVY